MTNLRVLLFGATGMIGQGVLRECLLDAEVTRVVSIVRTRTGQQNDKLKEIEHSDFSNFAPLREQLTGFEACFFCLGVSSSGMNEADYSRITYDYTFAAATVLAAVNPSMTFVYVSGTSTDSTERGSVMWARVKGKTENALLRLSFKAAYMFRPGVIQALHGIKSKTPAYRYFYFFARPLIAILRPLMPRSILTTKQIGRAMLTVAKQGGPKSILEPADISRVLTER
jgi:uncharacterized protein YbjT (DUF2867 family)